MQQAKASIARARRPVSFSGAGLSAESGIATFRGQGDSLWSQYDPMRLASEEGFRANPELVMDWYAARRSTLAAASPHAGHHALVQQTSWVHVTQNVDDLLERAGAPPDSVLHLHGSLLSDRCLLTCGYEQAVDLADPPGLRQCPQCAAPLRPTVVWFGEHLPEDTWTAARAAVQQCDLLLVVGTSAAVYPAAGLIELARENGAEILIANTDDAAAIDKRDVFVHGPAAKVLPQLFSGD